MSDTYNGWIDNRKIKIHRFRFVQLKKVIEIKTKIVLGCIALCAASLSHAYIAPPKSNDLSKCAALEKLTASWGNGIYRMHSDCNSDVTWFWKFTDINGKVEHFSRRVPSGHYYDAVGDNGSFSVGW